MGKLPASADCCTQAYARPPLGPQHSPLGTPYRTGGNGRVYISASPNYGSSQQLTLKTGVACPSDVREKKPAQAGFFVSGGAPLQKAQDCRAAGAAAHRPQKNRRFC